VNLRIILNAEQRSFEIAGDEPLIDVLRGDGLASVRLSCGIGLCGACTVLIDGDPVSSCLLHAALAEGREVTTVEGLAGDDPVLRAFDEAAAFQCGYCTPGMVLTAKSLAERNPRAGQAEVRHWMNGNLCRCGSYRRIEQAIASYLEEVARVAPDGPDTNPTEERE
jgi:aerobic-type carbon monoxide dehydrogenase small subunit (CoxS/CutS family)